MRKVLFWLHLSTGCFAGAVVFIMSLTGVMLTYERQILAAGAPRVKADSGVKPYSVETLLEKYQERHGALPPAVLKRAGSDEPVEFQMGREGTVYMNPYTGEEMSGGQGARRFFRAMTDWHRWLGQNGEGRETGRAITGACNLAFLFLVLSGMYLWIPRGYTWKHFRAILLFRGGLEGKARDFNWHNVFGIWMAAPLALVVASGAVMSYPWANDLLYRMASGAPAPAVAKKKGGTAGKGKGKGAPAQALSAPAADLKLAGLDAIWSRVETSHTGWRSIGFRLPGSPDAPWQVTVDKGNGARPDLRTTLTFDGATGELVRREEFASLDAGRRARTWMRWLHTGEVGGMAGQTLAGLASLAGVMLVYTGIALSLRRYAAWRR